ncbi:MAG: SPOR domain-containing protein [Bacteroidaceae bacterium]|nr:SPOR domain-containing protein [Bacteroidaceae bacterium]
MKKITSPSLWSRMSWRCCDDGPLWHSFSFIFAAIILFLAFSCPAYIYAQENFTDYLTSSVAGAGNVKLHQDPAITALVNGKTLPATAPARRPAPHKTTTPKPSGQDSISLVQTTEPSAETLTDTPVRSGRRTYVNGYRIQVYSGGNNRRSKQEASAMAGRVRSQFPDASVYTHFVSPHWICRVGDFRTVEEANDLLRQMRSTGNFNEAIVVKSKVAVLY